VYCCRSWGRGRRGEAQLRLGRRIGALVKRPYFTRAVVPEDVASGKVVGPKFSAVGEAADDGVSLAVVVIDDGALVVRR